ncbi:gliding motility-associated C-terminal domain-containing protein [Flavobacterium chilense]|uniref:Gliding motility-associated C-terminal domain-containing protein n=1 Tax=Flavobacterium chilense TaxID=946677 RepID=A0A1M7MVH2_9FLAO|nr:gliding motility-associated C-terminal domain-containing protein [Flavobacterium chilense]SHM95020.1 gliding motility-associated C-terminal domain-containing protein [Flavobacterium chilense]
MYIHKQRKIGFSIKKKSTESFCILIGLFILQKGHAQFTNNGDVQVNKNTILSVYEDYLNKPSGSFINDGEVYIFKDWRNDGEVSFNKTVSNGQTFFNGTLGQFIEGDKQSDFQNVIFDNAAEDAPFYLGTTISVNKNALFQTGIVNAVDWDGLVIFNENSSHQKVRDQSFVDGKVQKIGKTEFQFPVGSGKFFRPSFHDGTNGNNIYTTQYFHKNSDDLHSHLNKDVSIITINDQEYWEVKQDQGAEKVVLSLTLDNDTTPPDFFVETATTKLAIVRWDDTAGKWVNDGGVLSDPVNGEAYQRLLTGQVGGYGLFTMAIVKKEEEDDELIVYNAISPNGDGVNDTFHIKGIDKYPDNTVEIYNRWGVKVYEARSYNETDVMFGGYSDGRTTINRNEKLPTGTYFYILNYKNNKDKMVKKSGYLYINNN